MCVRLIPHIKRSPECSNNLDMVEFKITFTKFKAKMRKFNPNQIIKEGFKQKNAHVKKREQKRRDIDMESFKP